MPVSSATVQPRDEVQGSLASLNLLARELVVETPDAGRRVVHVAPDCDVRLRGEPVRLRLLQPRDRVRLVGHATAAGWVAFQLWVNEP
jgi:hypothetical protein